MTHVVKIEYRRLPRWDWWSGGVKRATGGIWTWAGHVGPLGIFLYAAKR